MKEKYAVDENICQAFVRLFVELIGDPDTKAILPRFFDKWDQWAKYANIAFFVGTALMAAGAVADFWSIAAAGFVLENVGAFSSLAAFLKEKHIKKAQKEIREELISKHWIKLA